MDVAPFDVRRPPVFGVAKVNTLPLCDTEYRQLVVRIDRGYDEAVRVLAHEVLCPPPLRTSRHCAARTSAVR